MSERQCLGYGPPILSEPTALGRKLVALCEYRVRQKIGRLDRVAVQLWLDGFDVPAHRLRAGLQSEAIAVDREERNARDRDDVAYSTAYGLARGPLGLSDAPELNFTDRIAVLSELIDAARDGDGNLRLTYKTCSAAISRSRNIGISGRRSTEISVPTKFGARVRVQTAEQSHISAFSPLSLNWAINSLPILTRRIPATARIFRKSSWFERPTRAIIWGDWEYPRGCG